MNKQFVLLCALVCLSAAQEPDQKVKHFFLDDANLIETSRGYAINGPSLLPNDWKAVSVNDESAQIIDANCQEKNLSKQDLQNSIHNAIQTLHSAESGQGINGRNGFVRCWLNEQSSLMRSSDVSISTINENGVDIIKYGEQDFSISKPGGFADNINRIFVIGDMVTFVFNDGRVEMSPASCLQASEQDLIQQVRGDFAKAKQNNDSDMQKLQQDMQNMNHQMRVDMQKMQQDMNIRM